MIALYYETLFVLSVIFLILYVCMWHKLFDITFTIVFTLAPLSCLGYVMGSGAENFREAVLANKVIYIGGSFLPYFIMLSVWNLCEIKINRWIKVLLFSCCIILYTFVLSTGRNPYFYRNVSSHIVDGRVVLDKDYGVMHQVFFFYIVLLFGISICSIIYSYFQKKQVSRKILFLLLLPDAVCMLSYFVGRRFIMGIDLVPIGYVFAEFMYLLIAYRVNLYDIEDVVIDSITQEGENGFIAFDFQKRYLGSNKTAKEILPDLNDLTVDREPDQEKQKRILHWLDSFIQKEEDHEFLYSIRSQGDQDERIYKVDVGYLYNGVRRRGYIITMTDDTTNRKYIELLDHYNEDLLRKVEEKTQHIVEMHDNLIMSMAAMVESRDNSTGGHIKRTSKVVAILIDEMRKDGDFPLSDEFCKNVIKAAPMHDLGKIAVDDAILRKPGRFTDEEFEKMKHHAAEGARVIHEILKNTDDEAFRILAENVAHYHHERWDGSGYPEKLKGEQIPLEARIMAIADVYDALVSKRVYKESMSFEQADAIIMEGMGKHFDAKLAKYYVKARPRLEEYYRREG